MGWLFMRSLSGFGSPKAYLDHQFTWNRDGLSSRVLKSTLVGKSVYYAAIERVQQSDGDRVVFAAVCLIRYRPKARDGLVFGYKDLDETVGPYERSCPASILDQLTPTDSTYALEWRAACRAVLETARAERARPTPKSGDIITFADPITFRNGRTIAILRVIPHPRKSRAVLYVPVDGAGYYRIPAVKRRAYVLSSEKTAQV